MIVPPLSNTHAAAPFAQNQSVEDVSRKLVFATAAQRRIQLAEMARVSQEMAARLTRQSKDIVSYQADRAIENAEIKRTVGSLSSKFGLISKVLQNLG